MAKLARTFKLDKETKNARRFQEEVEDGEVPMVGQIYVQKASPIMKGSSDEITVTIEAK